MAQLSTLVSKAKAHINDNDVEILLVEDTPDDVELALDDRRDQELANRILVARDGVEALDLIFRT